MWNIMGANKRCTDREILREHTLHQIKIRNMRPRIDNLPPKAMPHLQSRAKQERIKNDRGAVIDQQNKLLLQKMLEIDMKPSPLTPNSLPPKGGLQNFSLNKNSRIVELTKITDENKKILKRLQTAKSVYSIKKWKREFDHSQYLSLKLSENAGRIPRSISFDLINVNTTTPGSVRPITAAGSQKFEFSKARPFTSEGKPRSLNQGL
ncbi:unnamed protein product [Blepharisma stoltei]|uniref:Uncharacterized protein n=1 Tax=Blepharisma stoltei TaxID=1481888 RepID=A0AAU9IYE6_9CILI|nr:unnamed protein product [Blepharisma stoltei]